MAVDLAFDEQQQQMQPTPMTSSPNAVRRPSSATSRPGKSAIYRTFGRRWPNGAGWVTPSRPPTAVGVGPILDLYPLYEEMGRFLVPSPHLDTVALSGDLIARVGTEAQKQRVLPAIAAGGALVSVATLEPAGGFGPGATVASADRRGR